MKKLLIGLAILFMIVPSVVRAEAFECIVYSNLVESTNDGDATTYEYAINYYCPDGRVVGVLDFSIEPLVSNYTANFVAEDGLIFTQSPSGNPNDSSVYYSLDSQHMDMDGLRVYGGVDFKLGTYTINIPNSEVFENPFVVLLEADGGDSVYQDENNYSLTVNDIYDLGEYTIELFVGSLVFDFNENFDGTFSWDAHGESGIKINNLSSKGIRVKFGFNSNIHDLELYGRVNLRLSATGHDPDCLDYYAITELDRSEYPEDWTSNIYDKSGLFSFTYFTDAACTIPLQIGSEYDPTANYYVINNFDMRGNEENFEPLGYMFDIEPYDQTEYVYPGIDYHFGLTGGSLEDVQRVQRGNKKIGTITVTIVGV